MKKQKRNILVRIVVCLFVLSLVTLPSVVTNIGETDARYVSLITDGQIFYITYSGNHRGQGPTGSDQNPRTGTGRTGGVDINLPAGWWAFLLRGGNGGQGNNLIMVGRSNGGIGGTVMGAFYHSGGNIRLYVAHGGRQTAAGRATYGGGAQGTGNSYGGGGGATVLYVGGNLIGIAGGGGGGGSWNGAARGLDGGSAGGSTGAGGDSSRLNGSGTRVGQQGSTRSGTAGQTAGGWSTATLDGRSGGGGGSAGGGQATAENSNAGVARMGGNGGSGGGGGGWYGGGSGGNTGTIGGRDGAGGGGSSHNSGAVVVIPTTGPFAFAYNHFSNNYFGNRHNGVACLIYLGIGFTPDGVTQAF